jgi:hypothetical protein
MTSHSSEGKFHSIVAFPTIMVVLEAACLKGKSLQRGDAKDGIHVQPKFEQCTGRWTEQTPNRREICSRASLENSSKKQLSLPAERGQGDKID